MNASHQDTRRWSGRVELLISSDPVVTARHLLMEAVEAAVARKGRCLLSLAGGSTPLPLYRSLAEVDLPWGLLHIFWGDERYSEPHGERSNWAAAHEALLSKVPVIAGQVHPWPLLASPQSSAAAYASEIRRVAGDPPEFDVTLLGLGADCHTASLFPGQELDPDAATGVTEAPDGSTRLTLGRRWLSASRLVIFLATGEAKLAPMRRLLDSADDGCPARLIGARERLLLVTDGRPAQFPPSGPAHGV